MSDGAGGATGAFRKCGACGRGWPTVDAFLDDGKLRVVGLQVAGHFPEANLMVFEHACGTSISVLTSRLRFLLPRPANEAASDMFGTEKCRELCLRLKEWAPCDNPCINAADRRLLQMVLERKANDPERTP